MSVCRMQPGIAEIINNYSRLVSDFWTTVYSLPLHSGTTWILFLLVPTDYSTLSPEYWSRNYMLFKPMAFHKLSICNFFFPSSPKGFGFSCNAIEVDLFSEFINIWVVHICIHFPNVKMNPFWLCALLSCRLGVCENTCFNLLMDDEAGKPLEAEKQMMSSFLKRMMLKRVQRREKGATAPVIK